MGSLVWTFAAILTILGATVGSTKRINEGNEALVERLGRYHRKLKPGLNFWIIPFIDEVVTEGSIKERVLDTEPREATTRDNIRVKVDAVIFWEIVDLERAYYKIDNSAEKIEVAITELVTTILRSEVGLVNLEDTNSLRDQLIRSLQEKLDEATAHWGIKIIRVGIQDIIAPPSIQLALEKERSAISERRALETQAAGKKEAAMADAEAIAGSVQRIAQALRDNPNSQHILKYLVAQNYVDANLKLGESSNSKIVFMDPKALTEGVSELIQAEAVHLRNTPGDGDHGGNGN
jgi:regulator of protease activity HflC (stomatin/prohibitin superfamily)